MAFVIFTALCNQHHNPFQNIFVTQKRNLMALSRHPQLHSPLRQALIDLCLSPSSDAPELTRRKRALRPRSTELLHVLCPLLLFLRKGERNKRVGAPVFRGSSGPVRSAGVEGRAPDKGTIDLPHPLVYSILVPTCHGRR